MPIRTLLQTTGPIVQALKPCFMMTPLTVSQFLPPGFRFDVVIFDEASQVRPSDAVNCIYRGDQLVVAGDEQQLPPTSFFLPYRDGGGESGVGGNRPKPSRRSATRTVHAADGGRTD